MDLENSNIDRPSQALRKGPTSKKVVGEILGGVCQRDANWQQQGVDVHAQHGQHDDKGCQQGCALAGGDDGARDPVIKAALQQSCRPEICAGDDEHELKLDRILTVWPDMYLKPSRALTVRRRRRLSIKSSPEFCPPL